MARTKRTDCWSYKVGEKGRNRVRAYEDAKSGLILLEFRDGGRRKRVSTGHRNRERAKVQADEAAAKIGKREPLVDEDPGPTTLQRLFDIYGEEVTPTKAKTTQVHDRLAPRLFSDCFGPNTPACELNVRHQEKFVRERGKGLLGGKPVGQRTIERDLKWLHAVLNWAVLARDMGCRMLDRNPLKGVPIPKEPSPRRPLLSDERYRAMLAVAEQVGWRFGGALVMAHETGHRIGAILKLRWADIDRERRQIVWRKDSDKMGFEHETPLSDQAVTALKELRENNPGIGEAWVFPAPKDASKPSHRYLAREWWRRAEKQAGLEHIKGLGWHGLRRKFATELKSVPLTDLSHLGGWKTVTTVIECYQQPDEVTMRKALLERNRLTTG